MDDSVSKLLGMAVGLLLCLAAFGAALHLQDATNAYLEQMKDGGPGAALLQQQALGEPLALEGFELVSTIAHQLRQKDVQLDNGDLVFEAGLNGDIGYTVDGNDIDTWSKLLMIDQSKSYRITYKISGLGAVEVVICDRIN